MKDMAVVICSYNRADRVEAAVAAAHAQTARQRLDLVVVDDGSSPPIPAAMVQKYGGTLVRHPTNRGLGQARNSGIGATEAPVVAFTDDDCLPCPEWAAALLGAYEDGDGAVGVGGPVTGASHGCLLGRYYQECPPVRPLESALGKSRSLAYRAWVYAKANVTPTRAEGHRAVFSLAGANMSFKREALDAIGRFEAEIRFGGDDEEICQRLRRQFGDDCLKVTPGALVVHDYELTLADLVRRAFGYGAGNARNAARYEEWTPTVFPVPVVTAALLAVAAARYRGPMGKKAALAALLAPVVLAPRWPLLALAKRRLEPLAFAYLQLLQEAATNSGYFYACALQQIKGRFDRQ